MKKQSLGRKAAKRGPVPPKGGRVRIMINLPVEYLPVVKAMAGKSLSGKIVGLISRLTPPSKKATTK